MGTDAEWEKWGKKNPYFGVLTHKRFRMENLTDDAKREFFESGRDHIRHVLGVVRDHIDQQFVPRRALDFGCGVGRLVIPLAEVAGHVVGLDVSESMLKEAMENCKEYSATNVELLMSDDDLSALDGGFDFIHSFIVFQHIPVERGKKIFLEIMDHLEEGGVCAVQFTYSKTVARKRRRKALGVPRRIVRIIRNVTSSGDPGMQMNSYAMNDLFYLMQMAGVRDVHVEFTDHGGALGGFLYFQKPRRHGKA